jgi:TATA-binding protein-associated factor Taf7
MFKPNKNLKKIFGFSKDDKEQKQENKKIKKDPARSPQKTSEEDSECSEESEESKENSSNAFQKTAQKIQSINIKEHIQKNYNKFKASSTRTPLGTLQSPKDILYYFV